MVWGIVYDNDIRNKMKATPTINYKNNQKTEPFCILITCMQHRKLRKGTNNNNCTVESIFARLHNVGICK